MYEKETVFVPLGDAEVGVNVPPALSVGVIVCPLKLPTAFVQVNVAAIPMKPLEGPEQV